MYYKLKRVSIKNDSLFITVAESNIRPIRYHSGVYCPKESLDVAVRKLLKGVFCGDFRPLPSCNRNLFRIGEMMRHIECIAADVSLRNDEECSVNYVESLADLAADIAISRFYNKEYTELTLDELMRVLNFNAIAKGVYARTKEELGESGIVFIHSASYSSLFPEYDVLCDEMNNVILARRENYDNHGHLDNSESDAIYLTKSDENTEEESDSVYNFFAQGILGTNFPKLDWYQLLDIPGSEAAKVFYEQCCVV